MVLTLEAALDLDTFLKQRRCPGPLRALFMWDSGFLEKAETLLNVGRASVAGGYPT